MLLEAFGFSQGWHECWNRKMETNETDILVLNPHEKSEQELDFLKVLNSRIVGQEGAKAAASRAKRRANNPLRNKRGPIYKALLIGKSRTGKTLTAETTALSLHSDAEALVRVDCADYQHGHEVSRLLGAPPSYVGFDDPSKNDDDQGDKKNAKTGKGPTALLARANLLASRKGSKCPVTIILLDEIEKAHTSLKDTLLAIFDKGKIRLANNVETDFTDCIFYLTSNLGMEQLEEFGRSIGFQTREILPPTEKDVAAVVGKELKKHFRPEFLKRLDETVIFAPLNQHQLEQLVQMELGFIQERVTQGLPETSWFEIKCSTQVENHVLALAQKTEGGVAEIKQIIEREIIDALGVELEKKTIAGGDLVNVDFDKEQGKLTFALARGKGQLPKATSANGTARVIVKAKASTGLQLLKELIEIKLKEAEPERQIMQRTIRYGSELGALAKSLGGEAKDLESIQKSFMTAEAHRLFWSKVSNVYWFWKIYQQAAAVATDRPITLSDVQMALQNIRTAIGINKVAANYDPNKDTTVNGMLYLQEGILLLSKAEDKSTWEIVVNPIYR